MTLKAYLELVRPVNCLMSAIATMIGYFVSFNKIAYSNELFFLMLGSFFVCGFGQAINDFFDSEVDKKIK
ncbi:MAG: hypothetical protein Q7K42_05475 [Candidatus Diapherotrites archaeon]|nr:hypothetical protein [Candidatus Diapherotrites archaeon]